MMKNVVYYDVRELNKVLNSFYSYMHAYKYDGIYITHEIEEYIKNTIKPIVIRIIYICK